jgi:hypothetical protein
MQITWMNKSTLEVKFSLGASNAGRLIRRYGVYRDSVCVGVNPGDRREGKKLRELSVSPLPFDCNKPHKLEVTATGEKASIVSLLETSFGHSIREIKRDGNTLTCCWVHSSELEQVKRSMIAEAQVVIADLAQNGVTAHVHSDAFRHEDLPYGGEKLTCYLKITAFRDEAAREYFRNHFFPPVFYYYNGNPLIPIPMPEISHSILRSKMEDIIQEFGERSKKVSFERMLTEMTRIACDEGWNFHEALQKAHESNPCNP